MGFCTCMKTVEITKHKMAASGVKPQSTFQTFGEIYRKEGIRGINKGVNGRWREVLSPAENAAYERRAAEELGDACAQWLANGALG